MGMGYQGFVKMYATGAASDPAVLLATGASVNLVLEPIYSSAVWGAGWYNAASSAHYADSAIRYEGTVDVEMQYGAGGIIWDFLEDWIVSYRAYPKSLDISPDGARIYQYRTAGAYHDSTTFDTPPAGGAFNTSAGFSTSEGSFLTASLGVVALTREEKDASGSGNNYSNYSYLLQRKGIIGSDCAIFSTTNPLNVGGYNTNPIPFWRTEAQLLTGPYATPFTGGAVPQTGTQTVEWSVDVTQNSIWLYVCNGSRLPIALLQGPMDVSGSVTLFHQNGVFDPVLGPTNSGTLTSPYLYAENTWFRVTIANPESGPADFTYLEVPAVVIESDDYSIPGLDAVVNRVFSMKGMGGRCYSGTVLPPFLMSAYDGQMPDAWNAAS